MSKPRIIVTVLEGVAEVIMPPSIPMDVAIVDYDFVDEETAKEVGGTFAHTDTSYRVVDLETFDLMWKEATENDQEAGEEEVRRQSRPDDVT